MNHRYQILGSMLVCLFAVLLLLQVTFGFFSPKNANVSRPQSALRQNHTSNASITVITGGQGGVGRIPDQTSDPVVCTSGITSTPADVLKLLAPGWTLSSLSEQYRNGTQQLCYDNWKAGWNAPGGTWVKIADFLSVMGWPSDLFDASAGTQILIVSGPDLFQKSKTNGTNGSPTQPPCAWQPDLGIVQPKINLCDLGSVFLKALLLAPLKWAVNATTGDANFGTTPAAITYANPHLGAFWNVSLALVNALLVLAVAWTGFRYMTSIGSWQMRADLIAMLPRIVLALMAAYLSTHICQIAIDGSNALGSAFGHIFILNLQQDPQDLFTIFCQIILCFLALILVLEEVVRYALLFILIGFGPLWAFSGAFRETQFIFKGALKALFAVAFLQPAQVAVMTLGQQLTQDLGGNAGSPLYYLASIALMLFVLFMMSLFLRAGGFSFNVEGAGFLLGAWVARSTTRTVTRVERTITHRPETDERGSNHHGIRRTRESNTTSQSTDHSTSGNRTHRKRKRLPPYVLNSRRVQETKKQPRKKVRS